MIIDGCFSSGSVGGLSKKCSDAANEALFASVFERLPRSGQARLRALTGPGAGDWLSTTHPNIKGFWLQPTSFAIQMRRRLGQPILIGSTCPFCSEDVDDLDIHVDGCMSGGARGILHSYGKEAVADCCNMAGSCATYESRCFPSDPTARIGVMSSFGGATDLIDVAFTNPRRQPVLTSSIRLAGAAATGYEEVKRRRYGTHTAALGPDFSLVPFVVDTLGCFGASATLFIQRLALQLARREGILITVASSQLRARIASAVARGMSLLMLRAVAAIQPSFDHAELPPPSLSSDESTAEWLHDDEDDQVITSAELGGGLGPPPE